MKFRCTTRRLYKITDANIIKGAPRDYDSLAMINTKSSYHRLFANVHSWEGFSISLIDDFPMKSTSNLEAP